MNLVGILLILSGLLTVSVFGGHHCDEFIDSRKDLLQVVRIKLLEMLSMELLFIKHSVQLFYVHVYLQTFVR